MNSLIFNIYTSYYVKWVWVYCCWPCDFSGQLRIAFAFDLNCVHSAAINHLPFRSGGLCGRLLIVKLSKSLRFGASSFSASNGLVTVVKLRFDVICCRRFWCCMGDTLAAERNATASANRLSFASFCVPSAFCDAVKLCSNWFVLLLYTSSSTECWFGKLLLLLFSSWKAIEENWTDRSALAKYVFCPTFTSAPLNSVKNESTSNGFSTSWRKISSESLHSGSNELRSHELPAISWFCWFEPVAPTASYFFDGKQKKKPISVLFLQPKRRASLLTCRQAEMSTIRPSLSGHHSSVSSMNGIAMAVPLLEVNAASVSDFIDHKR